MQYLKKRAWDGLFWDQSLGLEHVRKNYKRPAEKDDALLTLPKKPCTAALKELSMSPFPEKGLEFRGPRPDSQARDAYLR